MKRLLALLALHGPSGDEGAVADWLEEQLRQQSGTTLHRMGDNVIALRGRPRTAIFAHIDTTGYTLGYRRKLIDIGAPAGVQNDRMVSAGGLTGRLRIGPDGRELLLKRVRDASGGRVESQPGSRWVFGRPAKVKRGFITAPYLDNRAGVWTALRALDCSDNLAVAFSTGEERHGHGARVCGDWLYREHGITQALIADLTWHTPDTPCGKGVVISLRDAYVPRQTLLDRVLQLATESGVPHQREVQSAGSSDGGHLLRSSVPIDWVFVGAPQKSPHTARERAALSDLNGMSMLLAYLAERL